MADDQLPSASLLENVRLNSTLLVPNVVQGLFRRRRRAVAAATRANVDGHAAGLLAGLARKYQRRPLWVRAGTDRALLVLDPGDGRRVLDGSPDPWAADPPSKRKGMVAFQPLALTLSRGEDWESRRRFTEAVLETREPPHHLVARFVAVTRDEVELLLGAAGGELGIEALNDAVQRITRRVVLGDGAADDQELTALLWELMAEANKMPGEPSERLPELRERVAAHVERAEEGSLAGLFADAPTDQRTAPADQVHHWLFALGDTLAINLIRALALLATHPEQHQRALDEVRDAEHEAGALTAAGVVSLRYVGACLHEAMRLWPTTPILSRIALRETELAGVAVPEGTQALIVNSFAHRDSERLPYADRFAPEEWLEGTAADEPAFNHFGAGPQGCPGVDVALLVGKTAAAELLEQREISLLEPRLDPTRPLPNMLDYFSVRIGLQAA